MSASGPNLNLSELIEVISHLTDDEPDYVRIALEAYQDDLFNHQAVPQARIAQAVMGLEALLLGEDERTELSYKLRNRAAVVLGTLRIDGRICAAVVGSAYGYRSKYVHGSVKKPPRPDEAVAIATEVGGYLRTLIVVFLVATGKKRLIQLCDQALIDPSSRRELEEETREARRLLGVE